jgi:hypothetical protein
MAGIRAKQFEVFKIGTDMLKMNDWDLTLSKDKAMSLNLLVSLFDSQMFDLINQILTERGIRPPKKDYTRYVMSVVNDGKKRCKRDFKRALQGFKVNGVEFKRFVGTTGGLKANSVIFVNANIIDELNRRCECGRNKDLPVVPAKYEAYKALTCSASQKICEPNGILVVSDVVTHYATEVIDIDEDDKSGEPIVAYKKIEAENDASDGYNLCTYDYMKRISESLGIDYVTTGVCLRNAYCKGMLYAFPIVEFCEKYLGSYIVKDIWGHEVDIRTVDMILTESSLKFWNSYNSSEDYINQYRSHGYNFRVTKIIGHELEDIRELNYQYLQSYDFTDEDIKELCQPTVDYLTGSLCGDYEQTLKFLGLKHKDKVLMPKETWQKALLLGEDMINDPNIIYHINKLINKKIDNAKIGKLICNGNYQQLSGDPFLLMQHICGLKETGLLQAKECYSSYWINKTNELVVFRSPMIGHNNIRKMTVINNDEAQYWYQYMGNVFITNGFDSACMALSGADMDGDSVFSTNNNVLIRCYKELPAINCVQHKAEKKTITQQDIVQSNFNGFGNSVGSITNRATAMFSVQAQFEKHSKEYKELEYRILCTQLYQQNEIDKIKGIVAKPMAKYWYSYKDCPNEYQKSICCEKKPYFMIYRYEKEKTEYRKFIKDNNSQCIADYGIDIKTLLTLPYNQLTEEQKNTVKWYNKFNPVDMNLCTINRICFYIESVIKEYKSTFKERKIDYTQFKVKRRCTQKHKEELKYLMGIYISHNQTYQIQDKIDTNLATKPMLNFVENYIIDRAKEMCPNDDERWNIILDMCNEVKDIEQKDYCWIILVDILTRREENSGKIDI